MATRHSSTVRGVCTTNDEPDMAGMHPYKARSVGVRVSRINKDGGSRLEKGKLGEDDAEHSVKVDEDFELLLEVDD